MKSLSFRRVHKLFFLLFISDNKKVFLWTPCIAFFKGNGEKVKVKYIRIHIGRLLLTYIVGNKFANDLLNNNLQ